MEFVQITWMRAIRIWWAVFWRALLILLPLSFALGYLGRLIGGFGFAEPVLIVGISAVAFIIVFKIWVLGRNFGDFELLLMRETPK